MKHTRETVEDLLKSNKEANLLFTQKHCGYSKNIINILDQAEIEYENIVCLENRQLTEDLEIKDTPCLVKIREGKFEKIKGALSIFKALEKVED